MNIHYPKIVHKVGLLPGDVDVEDVDVSTFI